MSTDFMFKPQDRIVSDYRGRLIHRRVLETRQTNPHAPVPSYRIRTPGGSTEWWGALKLEAKYRLATPDEASEVDIAP